MIPCRHLPKFLKMVGAKDKFRPCLLYRFFYSLLIYPHLCQTLYKNIGIVKIVLYNFQYLPIFFCCQIHGKSLYDEKHFAQAESRAEIPIVETRPDS